MSGLRPDGGSGVRTTCLNCARKHLAQASILMMEAAQGYPYHAWFAMGHMAEAADELVQAHPGLANEIREHRKLYEDNRSYPVPVEELIKEISKLERAAPTEEEE